MKFPAIRRASTSLSSLPAAGRRATTRRMLDAATSATRRVIGKRLGPCKTQDATADILGEVLGGAAADSFKKDLARYAMGGTESPFLSRILRGSGARLKQALEAIFGRRRPEGVDPRARAEAEDLLRNLGYEIRKPSARPIPFKKPTAEGPKPPQAPGRPPRPAKPSSGGKAPPETPQRPQAPAGPPRGPGGFPIAELAEGRPLPTGAFPGRLAIEMKHVHGSSNVYAYGYDEPSKTLRVQFLGAAISRSALRGRGHRGKRRVRGTLGKTVTRTRRGPGPVYDYHGVPKRVYMRLDAAGSKGKAVWDNLRIRGTIHGHQYDYELVAASVVDVVVPLITPGGLYAGKKVGRISYVPRKAVGLAGGRTGFKGRTITQGAGVYRRSFRSILPNEGMATRRTLGG